MSMTLATAAENIGRGVVYQSFPGAPREDGKIVSVNDTYVMVSYRGQVKATPPDRLEFLHTHPPKES